MIEAQNQEQALRSTIISIKFDNHETVNCPIGDFFGTGYQVRPLNTWYTHVDAEGFMSCVWVMPFKNSCILNIKNDGEQLVKIKIGRDNICAV
jgi:Protein of unknown function (DUF2961).